MNFNRIISISGPQGSGKSSVLAALKEMTGDRFIFDDFKVSRTIQADRGFAQLSDILVDWQTMHDFQEDVFTARALHEYSLVNDNRIIFTERSYADFAAYHRLWTTKFDEGVNHTASDEFYEACRNAMEHASTLAFYLPFADHVKFEHDPNRGFESDIDEFDTLLLSEFEHIDPRKVAEIEGETPADRAQNILDQLEEMGIE